MFLGLHALLAALGIQWICRTAARPFRSTAKRYRLHREARLRKRIHKLEGRLAKAAAKNQPAQRPRPRRFALPLRPLIPAFRRKPATLPAPSTPAGAGLF